MVKIVERPVGDQEVSHFLLNKKRKNRRKKKFIEYIIRKYDLSSSSLALQLFKMFHIAPGTEIRSCS